MIYANHAGTSWPKPPEVGAAMEEALRADPTDAAARLDASRVEIARFLGAPQPERLLLTPGCTSALAVGLHDLPWTEGDVLVTSSLEHHALLRPVEQLVRGRGVVHRTAPYRPGRPIDLDFVENLLRRGGVRLVAVTAASNVTGELLPIAELVRLAHEHGAFCLVDAAQALGVLPFDAGRLGVDLVTFAGHKGPLGPHGIGGLWAAPRVGFGSNGAACEIGPGAAECPSFPSYCDVGSVNLPAAAGLVAGLRWRAAHEGTDLGGSARALARRLVAALQGRPGVTVHGGNDAPRTATVSLAVESLPVDRAEAYFRSRGIVVRSGRHCATQALRAIGAPLGTLRISFGPLQGEPELTAILAALDAVGS